MAFAGASSSSFSDLKKYDVFINFRGEDTRDNFTSHLHAALLRNQIRTYIDNRLEKGDEIWAALVHAIKDSTVLLVIFSENYASSTWCLNELVEIMERKKSGQQHIIPVFYRVDPSHVRKQRGSYRIRTALAKHKWKDALFEAASLAGFDSRAFRNESDLIENIIKTVLRKLNAEYTNELRCPFIRDQNYACIEYLLRTQSRKVQIIGIWGMGGIGKTTIAAAIFQEFSPIYEGSCFLANVREDSSRHGLNYIFNKLLRELLQEDVHISTPKIISSTIVSRLRCKKVFIVLDDVNTSELLEDLLGVGHGYLGVGSKVIVTTRDKHVLTSKAIDQIHEVKEMNDQNSLKLFYLNAFNKFHPENGFLELSKRVVAYAKGIPLALKVLGSFLHSKSENEWDSALRKMRKIPNADIQKVLRLSFDDLDNTEKNIFLDIACFFKGQERGKVTMILNACGFYADIGIRKLLDKALITIDVNDSIQMHDLIQEMGQNIVREESIDNVGGRSRLWDSDEVCEILKYDKGTEAIESIFLDVTQMINLHISSHAFRKMPKLRLLAFEDGSSWRGGRANILCLPTNLELPNNLRYIQWHGCSMKSLPSFCWPNKLVELSMPYSNVEKLWDGIQSLPSLESIDLTWCQELIECPNLSGAPNLKQVRLCGCESLPSIHPSVFSLPRLKLLDVIGCNALRSLHSDYCSPSLQFLWAQRCSNLEEFSVPMVGDHPNTELYLMSTALSEVPSTIVHPKNLYFSFPISYALVKLPENFTHVISLSDSKKHKEDACIILKRIFSAPAFMFIIFLALIECKSLFELPDNIFELRSLRALSIHGSHVRSLPESIKYLQQLEIVYLGHCKMLQYVPPLPPSIEDFDAIDCISLETVSSLTSEPPRKHEATFRFHNCTNLDQHVYEAVLKDLNFRIEHGATTTLEEENGCPDAINDGNIFYYLPSKDNILNGWLPDYSTQASITIEVPLDSKFSCLVFCLVLSQYQSCYLDKHVIFRCECYLEANCNEWVHMASSSNIERLTDYGGAPPIEIMLDHVLLWYDAKYCKKIMEAIQETSRGSTDNPSLKFEFSALTQDNEEVVLKGCGIRLIYHGVKEREEIQDGIEAYESDEPQEADEMGELERTDRRVDGCCCTSYIVKWVQRLLWWRTNI